MLTAAITGATGITGYELTKLLKKHPNVEIKLLNSTTSPGKKVKDIYPDFDDGELAYANLSVDEINTLCLDVIFLCTPHKISMDIVPLLKTKIIDLSADYRFKNPETYEMVYGIEHKDKKTKAVYGMPELFKDKIKKARIIANPGCYATVCILSSYPIQKLAKQIIFDCKSGYSGAGRNSIYMKDHDVIKENIYAYNLTKHRHKYEIEQFIKTKISFTPHVIDAFQGIMCTAHIILKEQIDQEEIKNIFKEFYNHNIFIDVVDNLPCIKEVKATNKCLIGGFEVDENNQLVIVAVIDNLIKGAVGQAVQNMNIMFGLNEEEGLT